MKRFIFTLLVCLIFYSVAWGDAEINNSNLTAGYLRDLTPHTEGDPIYNPAGLAFEKRNFINVGVQAISQKYHSGSVMYGFGFGIAHSDDTSYFPDLSVHYRYDDRLSFSLGYYRSAGHGKTKYPTEALFTQIFIEAPTAALVDPPLTYLSEEAYHTLKAGFIYKATNNIGFSAGVIGVSGEKSVDWEFPGFLRYDNEVGYIHYKLSTEGVTGFASLHYKYDSWDFSVNFNGPVYLKWDNKIDADSGFRRNNSEEGNAVNFKDIQEDIPAYFSIGVKKRIQIYKGILELKTSFTCFLQNRLGTEWGHLWNNEIYSKTKTMELFNMVDNRVASFGEASEISFGLTWKPHEKSIWKFYGGYMYSDPGVKNIKNLDLYKPSLKSHNVGIGFDYKMSDNIVLICGVSGSFYEKEEPIYISRRAGYEDKTYLVGNVDAERYTVGFGIQYYF